MAEPIAQQVQIVSVTLEESDIKKDSSFVFDSQRVSQQFYVKEVAVSQNQETNQFRIKLTFHFGLAVMSGESDSGSAKALVEEHAISQAENNILPMVSIDAAFVITYRVGSREGLTENQFFAFGQTTGVFKAWPYWRE